jgi:hypothetical protein
MSALTDREGSAGWRRPDWPPEVEEHLRRVRAALPPLTDAQCEHVARLLAPWARPDPANEQADKQAE